MKVNLDKIAPTLSCNKEIENLNYFIQFNVYENINYEINSCDNACVCKYKSSICDIEYTCPNIKINSVKIVDTMEGVSLEGQHLTGKKLVIVGDIQFSLVITYYKGYRIKDSIVKKIQIPFSTFIIIPKEVCSKHTVNLKYLIEDISAVEISEDKILVSVTILIQYVDN